MGVRPKSVENSTFLLKPPLKTREAIYSLVVWHSSLTKTNENDLERVQKSALKLILKDEYKDYKSALKLLAVDSLFERREKLSLKFAKKCLKNENFKKLFPHRKSSHVMEKRKTEKYLIGNINTESYKKSAIPSMLRLLNEEEMRMNEALNISVPRESCFYNSISVKI